MTKLSVPSKPNEDPTGRAIHGAAQLATLIAQYDGLGLQVGELTVATLLYAAQVSTRLGGTKQQFMHAAAAAFDDAKDLFGKPFDKPPFPPTKEYPRPPSPNVASILREAKWKVARGWVQGDQAMKWRKRPGGKELVNCLVKDPYASRWSAIGAIDAAAPTEQARLAARDAFFQAIAESGWPIPAGSLLPTAIVDWNDYGYVPPVPTLLLPPEPDPSWPAEQIDERNRVRAEATRLYHEVTLPQWPKPKPDGRTKEQVLAMFDAAIKVAEEVPVRIAETEPVDESEGA
jgi:hypothetical protein